MLLTFIIKIYLQIKRQSLTAVVFLNIYSAHIITTDNITQRESFFNKHSVTQKEKKYIIIVGDDYEMLSRKNQLCRIIWCRDNFIVHTASKVADDCRSSNNHYSMLQLQEVVMKVVLIEKPKFISFILRKIYGIKKQPIQQNAVK